MSLPFKSLGKNIARYRQQCNLTQAELGVLTGLKPGRISAIESGKSANITNIARLAVAFGVTIDALMDEKVNP